MRARALPLREPLRARLRTPAAGATHPPLATRCSAPLRGRRPPPRGTLNCFFPLFFFLSLPFFFFSSFFLSSLPFSFLSLPFSFSFSSFFFPSLLLFPFLLFLFLLSSPPLFPLLLLLLSFPSPFFSFPFYLILFPSSPPPTPLSVCPTSFHHSFVMQAWLLQVTKVILYGSPSSSVKTYLLPRIDIVFGQNMYSSPRCHRLWRKHAQCMHVLTEYTILPCLTSMLL